MQGEGGGDMMEQDWRGTVTSGDAKVGTGLVEGWDFR